MTNSQFKAKMTLLKTRLQKKQEELKTAFNREQIKQEIKEVRYVMDVVEYSFISQTI